MTQITALPREVMARIFKHILWESNQYNNLAATSRFFRAQVQDAATLHEVAKCQSPYAHQLLGSVDIQDPRTVAERIEISRLLYGVCKRAVRDT